MALNTKENGSLTFFTYKDRESDAYVTVCLEMDIVKIDEDQKKSFEQTLNAAKHILELVCENKLDEKALNNPAPKEYWSLYKSSQASKPSKLLSMYKMIISIMIPPKSINAESTFIHRITATDLLSNMSFA